MLLPISDDDRHLHRTGYVTILLIVANLLVFFFLQRMGADTEFTYGYSVVPQEIVTGEDLVQTEHVVVGGESVPIPQAPGPPIIWLTVLTSMFMHGGFAHLFGNMLYLWIFGDNVENRFGAVPFLVFYLATGAAGTIAQVALDPDSVIPNLGASGAISGVLGAYIVLFPRNRVNALFLYYVVSIPAVAAIGIWILFQFINGYGAVMMSQETVGGVAYGAHIGGFLAGVILAFVMRGVIRPAARGRAPAEMRWR
jgi:membrane associated rhomboid family serine protease